MTMNNGDHYVCLRLQARCENEDSLPQWRQSPTMKTVSQNEVSQMKTVSPGARHRTITSIGLDPDTALTERH